MGLSQTITANGSKGHGHKFTLVVEELSADPLTNSSIVSINFQISGAATTWPWTGWAVGYSVTVNDEVTSGSFNKYGTNQGTVYSVSPLTLVNKQQAIPHNADGSKTISISFAVTDNTGASYVCGNASSSGNLTLTKLDLTFDDTDIQIEGVYFDSDHVVVDSNNTTLHDILTPVLLWPATETTAAITTLGTTGSITLNDTIKNYRFIYMEYKFNSSSKVLWTATYPVIAIDGVGFGSAKLNIYGIRDGAYTTRWSRNFTVNAAGTVLTCANATYNNGTSGASYTLPYRIYGIR